MKEKYLPTDLATTAGLSGLENKIENVSDLVRKADFDEIENIILLYIWL